MTILQLVIQWLLLGRVVLGTTDQEFSGAGFSNMVIHDGKIYVGAESNIHVLNASDLREIQKVKTCTATGCSNRNAVLLVNQHLNQLITCGHGNRSCEIRSLDNIGTIKSVESLSVSRDYNKPVTFMLNDVSDGVFTGITGRTLKENSNNFYIASYKINTNTFIQDSILHLGDGVNDYIVYFKAGFKLNGFVYYFTNQKYENAGDNWTSKIIRICQNDKPRIDAYNHFWSYTDIPVQCRNSITKLGYDFVQDVNVFRPRKQLIKQLNLTAEDWMVAATFVKGSHPERLNSGDSAVCLFRLTDIDQHILTAKKNFMTCNDSIDHRYLPRQQTDHCKTSEEFEKLTETLRCNNQFISWTYAIGDRSTTLSSEAVYSLNSAHHGFLGQIKVTDIGDYVVFHIGTSKGWLLKLNVNSEEAEVFEEKLIGDGQPITAIHVEDHGRIEYSMSDQKLVKYETVSCDNYSTCKATMETRNPLCGWCVYRNRSTFNDSTSCPYQQKTGHWLSSLTQCLSIDVDPKGIPINSRTTDVRVNFKTVVPELPPGYMYGCEIEGHTVTKNFTCEAQSAAYHTESKVEFYVTDGSKRITLAETDFLFYDCGHYNRCSDCVRDNRTNCSWNSNKISCVPWNQSSKIFIQHETECPKFSTAERRYLPSGISRMLTFNVANLVNASVFNDYKCKLNGRKFDAVRENDTRISCYLTATAGEKKTQEYTVEILYGASALDGENTVEVYNCGKLGGDCSVCRSLEYNNPNYRCVWCTGSCYYANETCFDKCNPPNVTEVIPSTAGLNGGILVTIHGTELGSRFEDVDNITLDGILCEPQQEYFQPSYRVTCKAGNTSSVTDTEANNNVVVFVNNQRSSDSVIFNYKEPDITGVTPVKGPAKGGTRLTIRGSNLGVGNRNVTVHVNSKQERTDTQDPKECVNAEVLPRLNLSVQSSFWIECNTPENTVKTVLEGVKITFDGGTVITSEMNFTYKDNPKIEGLTPQKGIASGGNRLTVTGKNFKNANKGSISLTCFGENYTQKIVEYCNNITSDTEVICPVPKLCPDLAEKLNSSRKRDVATFAPSRNVEIVIFLDGVYRSYDITYFIDPAFASFSEDNNIKMLDSGNRNLVIMGTNLNLVAKEDDVVVTVGVDKCDVTKLRKTNLTCVPPTLQPAPSMKGASLPEVNVSIGNVHKNVGYLQYVAIQNELAKTWIKIAAVIGGLLAVVVVIVAILIVIYRRKSQKMRAYQIQVEEQEMEIRQTFREEFADMHTSMLTVMNLIEQGCPFHHYQQYVFNVLCPADEKMESHPLLQEPVGSTEMKHAMEEFEKLIFNKSFLLSLISSMEKKIRLQDKANMCGYICTILLGRMDYLKEILFDLLDNLVQECAGKRNQKVLFRRLETIAEKLLNNWLSLCLYPHLKTHSGRPLYLLYKATQLHMEAGPIDAVTHDAKYTLSEEKLLKKYSRKSYRGSNEPTFEAKCLTLNVVVDNCRDIKVCKVLDCDTITQVKEKCLTQIYMNHPASNLTVRPEELELEWHAGTGGCLRLHDEDNTSRSQRNWKQLNTLAHYNVQDGSNMALVDPQLVDASHEKDYANLAQVKPSSPTSQTFEDPIDAVTDPLLEPGNRDGNNLRRWHLVKPEDATLAPGRSLITELYLNRLLTFKQSILEYVSDIYDTVLKEDILPLHVQHLYRLLDDLAEKNKVESDVLHTWKSDVYPVRIWASLMMKKPSIVFDIKSPPYVDTSMDVISQVFIECFSLESHKFTKDSATHKMIFSKEMGKYKEKVKEFYKNIKAMKSQSGNLDRYLEEVNELQQQQASFSKMSALHKLYKLIQPNMDEVLEDLRMNPEAQQLQLDKKLEEVNSHMEEEVIVLNSEL